MASAYYPENKAFIRLRNPEADAPRSVPYMEGISETGVHLLRDSRTV